MKIGWRISSGFVVLMEFCFVVFFLFVWQSLCRFLTIWIFHKIFIAPRFGFCTGTEMLCTFAAAWTTTFLMHRWQCNCREFIGKIFQVVIGLDKNDKIHKNKIFLWLLFTRKWLDGTRPVHLNWLTDTLYVRSDWIQHKPGEYSKWSNVRISYWYVYEIRNIYFVFAVERFSNF